MSEYETLGHMSEIYDGQEEGYYTPHHGVLSASMFRVVFNASAKTTTGVTLNEVEMVGEKLQQDLFIILMNFRQFKYGIIADIEKMYRQVLVHQDDRKYQKILWRNNEADPIRVFQLNTVTYGHACAPHCAIRALVQCAEDHADQYPKGAQLVKECFYVDDLLTGASSQQEVAEIKTELTSLLKLGGFNITKWKTNGSFDGHVEFRETEEQSVLGLFWNLNTDKFFYKIHEQEAQGYVWTKRRILSKIGKMYVPNGYIGPIIMRGKIIIQDLWRDQLSWDETVTGRIKETWEDFNNDLTNIDMINIDRWFGTKEKERMQLHGFCDASEKGYGAVLYTRIRSGGNYRTQIIASKSRVAPLKTLTMPRLELCAAHHLAKLMEQIIPAFAKSRRGIQIYCWSHSQITLQWVSKPTNSMKIFVAHKVGTIQRITEKFNLNWQWIAGSDNPADLLSRGTTIQELALDSRWWHGPDWLYHLGEEWPVQPSFREQSTALGKDKVEEIQREMRTVHFVTNQTKGQLQRGKWFKFNKGRQEILLNAYSSWQKLVNVTVIIFRALYNFRNPRAKVTGNISIEEERAAVDYLIRKDQENTYPEVINAATTGNRQLLAKLVVIWDGEQQFLRIDGRVQSENLTRVERYPIILSKEGALAPLMIREAHLKDNAHRGTQLMLQYLRKRYWITGARQLAKNIIRKCPTCFRQRMTGSEQLMASLPNIRTTPKRAFSKIGVDYAGPVMVRSSLGRLPKLTKAWIAVFVCLVTRAIHLELVSDATTAAFVAPLKRMISRRGMITEIISDNGTNFVGANNYLTMIHTQLSQDSQEVAQQFKLR